MEQEILIRTISDPQRDKNTNFKVLLIHPSLHRLYPEEKRGSKRHQLEPLSLEMVASHNPYNLKVDIYDMDVYPDEKAFEEYLKKEQPNVIGITINTPVVLEAKNIVQIARKILTDVFIVAGGNHSTHEPEHALSFTGADMVWKGDAEDFLTKLVELDIPRSVRIGKLGKVYTGKSIEDEEGRFVMDRLKFPYRHNPQDYFYTTMQTSRGCIWKCIYCGSADKGIRWRTSANVLQELEFLKKQGLLEKSIYFLDDCFLDYPQRVFEICQGIKERGYKLNFWIETRADTIKEPILKEIKQAGCYQMTFGVESGNQEILNSLGKRISLDCVRNAVKLVHTYGIKIRANFMIGHFQETEEQVMDTIRFAEELMQSGATTIAFYKVLPLPGTPLYRMVQKAGVKIEKGFEDFAWYGETVSKMAKVDPRRLDELHKIAYSRVALVSNKDRETCDY